MDHCLQSHPVDPAQVFPTLSFNMYISNNILHIYDYSICCIEADTSKQTNRSYLWTFSVHEHKWMKEIMRGDLIISSY